VLAAAALERLPPSRGAVLAGGARAKKQLGLRTDAILLYPLDFISRLCALVPPPRFHMLLHHGVLSAHATARAGYRSGGG
jgi:hypothetical protein